MEGMALIFLHIPKAAGTTMNDIIERQFPQGTVFTVDGARVRESVDEFKNLPEEERRRVRCLKGHIPFGLHEYLPHPTTYITVLRNPVDRIISHYYYVLRTPHHYLYNTVTAGNMRLRDYVSSGISPELMNGQTKTVSGLGKADMIVREYSSADLLEEAKRTLQDHFVSVGLVERFDETLVLFQRLLGWQNIFYVRRNVTKKHPSQQEIAKTTVEVIERENELDMALYEFAKQMFEKQIREQPSSFEREVQAFQRANKVWGPIWRGIDSSRRGKDRVKTMLGQLFA